MRPLALRTILLATDLMPANAAAVRTAADLARLADCRLHVTHAVEDGAPADADSVIRHVRDTAGNGMLEVVPLVTRGPPGAIVGQEARRIGADVVVLGPHRQRAKGVLGSTADRVVRTSATPCLILPVRLRLPLRTVLAPVDSSAGARGALAVALTWASALRDRHHGTRVIALHVAQRAESGHARNHSVDVAELEAEVASVRNAVAGIARVQLESIVLHDNDEAGAILKFADEAGVDLIVIGTRGQSMTAAAILGSTSSAVVRNASAPILLVPPEHWVIEPDA